MSNRWIRGAAAVCALGLTGVTVAANASAATPSPTPTPSTSATPAPEATATPGATPEATPAPEATATPDATPTVTPQACTPAETLSLINFNDFHGRLAEDRPDTVGVVGEIERLRADAGDGNSLLLSAGDNIGGSLFPSFSQDDDPAIELLNAIELDASAVGNHEFDRGYDDLRQRIDGGGERTQAGFPYLGANVYGAGTQDPVLEEYATFDRAGVKVAVIGAVTPSTAGMVSPAGISDIEFGDPVEAVNRVAAQLSDGDDTNGEADVIIAEYHDGGSSSGSLDDNMANGNFEQMTMSTAPEVDAIFQAHTHQEYAYDAPVGDTGRTRPVIQAQSYWSALGHVTLDVDADGNVCSYNAEVIEPSMTADEAIAAYPRAAAASEVLERALNEASVIGSQVVGEATAPITRATDAEGNENRLAESTLTNMVAQQFKEVLGNDDANFIGIQNPGGTRDDLDAGEITYEEAAKVLPFANSLMTTELTGAQFKTVLEQQWQRDENGQPLAEGRPFLALGLSDNVTYTYDESREMDDRITGIWINGEPLDPEATYTVGSGNFLIDGGDQFHELANGTNRTDTGRVDLEAWTDWLQNASPLSPDFARRGVSVTDVPEVLVHDKPGTISLGVPLEGGVAADTLTTASAEVPAPATVTARIGDVVIGEGTVTDNMITGMELTVPTEVEPGMHVIEFTVEPNGTVIRVPMVVEAAEEQIDPNVVTHLAYDDTCAPADGSREYTPGETYTWVACNAFGEPVVNTEFKVYETADNNAANLEQGNLVDTLTTNDKGEFQMTIPEAGYIGAVSTVTPEVRVIVGQNPTTGEPITEDPVKPGEPGAGDKPGKPGKPGGPSTGGLPKTGL